MDVQLYANSRRPGVGVRPRRESQQVLFVPREELTLRDCGEEELKAIQQSRQGNKKCHGETN